MRRPKILVVCITMCALWAQIWPTHLAAECITLPPCEALRQASVVFIADVLEAGPFRREISPTSYGPAPQPVRFAVIERFKGIPADHQDIATNIAFSSAETVFVTAGVRYLVYARTRQDGNWDTSCSRTKPAAEAISELSELRQCRIP